MKRSEILPKGIEMRYMESEIDPKIKKQIDEQIDHFLDEFMAEEYKGGQHIVAREHYDKVFHELLPKYLRVAALIVSGSVTPFETEEEQDDAYHI
jgi:hypothetical protein